MLKDKYDKGKTTTTSCEWSIKMEVGEIGNLDSRKGQ